MKDIQKIKQGKLEQILIQALQNEEPQEIKMTSYDDITRFTITFKNGSSERE